MPQATPRLQIEKYQDKDKEVDIVEFRESKILDELNINEIGQTLLDLVEARERPKLLLDFSNVDHLSSAALGELISNDMAKWQRVIQQAGITAE